MLGAVAGSSRSRVSPSACTWRSSQVDSDEKPLQLLRSWLLCSHLWLGIDQSGQGLLAFTRQEQALQVAAKFLTLVALAQQGIKVPGIGFQRLGAGAISMRFVISSSSSPLILPHYALCQHTTGSVFALEAM